MEIKNYIEEIISKEFKDSSENRTELALGLTTSGHLEESHVSVNELSSSVNDYKWSYFITLAFPQNHSFKIKHKEYFANGEIKILFEPIKYRDCTVKEQYEFIKHTFSKYLYSEIDRYCFFFEHCKSGDLHIHGRITTHDKTLHIKDIKLFFNHIFGLSAKYKNFCDVKLYNKDKWNDYQNKTSINKQHQTCLLPDYKNV